MAAKLRITHSTTVKVELTDEEEKFVKDRINSEDYEDADEIESLCWTKWHMAENETIVGEDIEGWELVK